MAEDKGETGRWAGMVGRLPFAWKRRNPYYDGPPSDHYDGLRFFDRHSATDKSFADLWRWQAGGGKVPWPKEVSSFKDTPPERVAGIRIVLVGHASLLIQAAGLNILVDPVWSERVSPVSFAGPKRVNPPGIDFEALPPIDAILVTHNHYDHLDLATVGRLHQAFRPTVIAPLGNDTIIRSADAGIAVQAHDWGDIVALSETVSVALCPAYHWSARGTSDRRMALWCSYAVKTPAGYIHVMGDTAYADGGHFRAIRAAHGTPDIAVLPIGAYEPRWFMKTQHVNPEEAVRIFADLGVRQAIGYHWGTFRLTNEGVEDPPRALAEALAEAGVPEDRFRAFRPGEVLAV